MTQFQEVKRLAAIEYLHDAQYSVASMMGIYIHDYENNPEYNAICKQLAAIEAQINAIAAYL